VPRWSEAEAGNSLRKWQRPWRDHPLPTLSGHSTRSARGPNRKLQRFRSGCRNVACRERANGKLGSRPLHSLSSMGRKAEQRRKDAPSHNSISPTAIHIRAPPCGDPVATIFQLESRDRPPPSYTSPVRHNRDQLRDKLNWKTSSSCAALPNTYPRLKFRCWTGEVKSCDAFHRHEIALGIFE
jgi:hypothetical protein